VHSCLTGEVVAISLCGILSLVVLSGLNRRVGGSGGADGAEEENVCDEENGLVSVCMVGWQSSGFRCSGLSCKVKLVPQRGQLGCTGRHWGRLGHS
jgi:hypothetical protein